MDFKIVTRILLEGFNRENVRYALIGGFSLGALGIPRSTVDIDFLIHHDDLSKVDKLMKDNGYECAFRSENVSQPEDIIGLKLQAIANDKDRVARECADIEALLDYYRDSLDWNLIEEYFSLFDQEERFFDLKRRFDNVK